MSGTPVWYEPHTFKVGDRVRVRLSGECRQSPAPGCLSDQRGVPLHMDVDDGLTGVIVSDETVFEHQDSFVATWMASASLNYYRSIGHPYNVLFDEPYVSGVDIAAYAAIELEPLTEEPS